MEFYYVGAVCVKNLTKLDSCFTSKLSVTFVMMAAVQAPVLTIKASHVNRPIQ